MRFGVSATRKVSGWGIGLLICSAALQAAPAPDAAALFKQNCLMCHRADGKGFPALKTPDFTDAKWHAAHPDKELIEVIKNGKKGTPMPAFAGKLSDDEIQALVSYIRTFDSSKKK
jgi:cbb3-type cytochrome c oxidase subunit III